MIERKEGNRIRKSLCAGMGDLLGKLGDEALVIVEEVFVTAEDPVHGFVAARAVSIVITLLLLLYLWLLLMLIVMLLLLLLHAIKRCRGDIMVLISRWYVRIQRWWHGENGVLSHKIFMSAIGIVIIITIIDNTSAILKVASPFRHDGAL